MTSCHISKQQSIADYRIAVHVLAGQERSPKSAQQHAPTDIIVVI